MTRFQTDFARLLSICAVLVIHATGVPETQFASGAKNWETWTSVFLNQWARFSVPVFVMLSGYGLGIKYRTHFEPGEFYSRRLMRIGIPFLVWSAVLLVAFRTHWTSLSEPGEIQASLLEILRAAPAAFLRQGADYHFYFFIIILQCYIVFGLLRRASWPAVLALFVLHLVVTSPSSRWLDQAGLLPRWHASFLVHWIFYFAFGIRMAAVSSAPPAFFPAAAAVLTSGAVFAEFLYFSQSDAQPGNYDHFSRWTVTAYAIAAWFFFARYAPLEGARGGPVEKGAALSFTVFIFHTGILRLLEATPVRGTIWIIPLLIVLSFSFAYILDLILKPAWLRITTGLPEKT